jgi:hypothetical protein
MKDFIDNIFYLYTKMVEFGINPLSIILIIFVTHVLRSNISIYSGKLKAMWTMLTALILGIAFSVLFYFISYYTLTMLIINIIINTMASSYSTEIMKMLQSVKEHFFPEVKDDKN